MIKRSILIVLVTVFFIHTGYAQNVKPEAIRLAVAGMSHGHISFILKRPDKGDFKLVGVFESDLELIKNLSQRYQLSPEIIYTDLGKMLDEVKPEAVVAFGSVYDHLSVVEACAPRGIHVMVEKPLAVNMKHAKRMAELAKEHDIHLLTDYETSWYPTTSESLKMVLEDDFTGAVRKVVIHDGHRGPQEIGCDKYFLNWLTDPVLNGGGALIDLDRGEVILNGFSRKLNGVLYKLFRYFLNNPHRVISRDELIKSYIWDNSVCLPDKIEGGRAVDMTVTRLRRLIESDTSCPQIIISIHGTGWILAKDAVR